MTARRWNASVCGWELTANLASVRFYSLVILSRKECGDLKLNSITGDHCIPKTPNQSSYRGQLPNYFTFVMKSINLEIQILFKGDHYEIQSKLWLKVSLKLHCGSKSFWAKLDEKPQGSRETRPPPWPCGEYWSASAVSTYFSSAWRKNNTRESIGSATFLFVCFLMAKRSKETLTRTVDPGIFKMW